ncbi:MAG: prolipoprotein diacylglyceryl transferase [Proteobacteria bacterium]|nr:prolipoprotein diacylglyceryl transferase [Pseudomonadota bacterium]MBU1715491.1 prolipoprotein diacylglyceryl transferase [Pseudomonadota bacterium]
MISYPEIDPVIFGLGPLKVRWYGLMYVLGFSATILLVQYQIKKFSLSRLADHCENLNFILILSLVLGARCGYVLFYNPSYYLAHPAEIIAIWQGGMSFHGALIGIMVGGLLYCKKAKLPYWQTADIYVVTIPIGLGLGRIGNFINGELFGRVTDVPWAMIFPAGGPFPRHPSQLYESLLEGLLLFSILWKAKDIQHQRNWPTGLMAAFFLIIYGLIRSFLELFREPDDQLGFIVASLTMGQILSFCMILVGSIIIAIRIKTRPR